MEKGSEDELSNSNPRVSWIWVFTAESWKPHMKHMIQAKALNC